jgi:ferredoxin
VRFSVDESRCTGHGRCYTEASEVFGSDELGFNDRKGETGSLKAELLDQARRGAEVCPEGAITVFVE